MADSDVGAYAVLYLGVAASWIGIPVVGAGVLAAAGERRRVEYLVGDHHRDAGGVDGWKWVSGALRMPRNAFLVWNAAAAILSTCVAALGAYGVGAAVIGERVVYLSLGGK